MYLKHYRYSNITLIFDFDISKPQEKKRKEKKCVCFLSLTRLVTMGSISLGSCSVSVMRSAFSVLIR